MCSLGSEGFIDGRRPEGSFFLLGLWGDSEEMSSQSICYCARDETVDLNIKDQRERRNFQIA